MTAFAVAAAASACTETTGPDDGNGDINVTGVAIIAPATSIESGQTLQLQATVNPSGVPQTVTWSTSDVTIATVSNSGLVTGTKDGQVTITATSTADPTRSDAVQLTVTCVLLEQADVGSGATLPPDTCYEARGALVVNSGALVVGEGVRILFGQDVGLTIRENATMNATGTAAKPITFTSIDAAGGWRGINFDGSRSASNRLHWAIVRNGGSANWSGASYSRSAVLLGANSLVDIQNTTISGSDGQGLTVYGGAEMTFENNTLSGNAVAAWLHPNTVRYFGPTSFAENTESVVRVVFGNNDAVTDAQTWRFPGVPYQIQDRFFVRAPLTIRSEVTLAYTRDASTIVTGDGSITADASGEGRITFRGVEPLAGYWKGIQILTAAAANVFDDVTFADAGGQAWTGDGDSRAMVYLEGNSKAVIRNSVFSNSEHYGLWVPAGGDITGFENNTFSENARTLIVHPNRAGAIAANNTFDSNAENKVRVTFGNNDAVETAQMWHDFGVPFYVTVRTFVYAPLTIAPGVELEFAQDASLRVTQGGSLNAVGTTLAPIAFRGGEDLTGYWLGIQYNTASASNVLTNVMVANAGSGQWFGGSNSTGSMHVTGSGLAALTNVTFQKSGGYAIIVSSGGSVSCTNVDAGGFMYYSTASASATTICP